MIDLPLPQLRSKEVVFDRRELFHLGCSDKLERPQFFRSIPSGRGFSRCPLGYQGDGRRIEPARGVSGYGAERLAPSHARPSMGRPP